MMAANRELMDAAIRHQVALQRYSAGEVRAALEMLRQAENQTITRLQGLDPDRFQTQRMQALIRAINVARANVIDEMARRSQGELFRLAVQEQQWNAETMQRVVPIRIDYATVALEELRHLVTDQPFSGGANAARTLQQWWDTVKQADQVRILDAIQMGSIQGEDVPSITRRVMEASRLTRRNAETAVRTAINHVTNSTRDEFLAANGDIVKVGRWISTLDGRTTFICMSRDGHFFPIGNTEQADVPSPRLQPPTARPPAHPG